jgi:uncharacterized membrane protein SpoIIM required for sporulation
VILDLDRFIAAERPHWQSLERSLDRLEDDPGAGMDLAALLELHGLYQRASADLAKVATFAAEPALRRYLESLVSRAYGEIHETRRRPHRLAPLRLLWVEFPRAFRRHLKAFALALLVSLGGAAFGGLALVLDPQAKEALLPFDHLRVHPSERVAQEERGADDRLKGSRGSFSAFLATHNTRVSLLCLGLGMTFGIGTAVMLFHNGVILGAVGLDFLLAGEGRFLLGWLLPHGAIEIPALLLAGQAGLVLAGALAGWGDRTPFGERLRRVTPDLGALVAGLAVMLAWAGFVEGFLSQYHEPVLPYALKIGFGVLEGVLLVLFLARAGRKRDTGVDAVKGPS